MVLQSSRVPLGLCGGVREGRRGAGRPSPHDLSQISEHCDYTEPNGNFAGLRLITSGKGASCGQHQR